MSEKQNNFPDREELEKELADYLSRKYGGQVKVVSAGVLERPARDGEAETETKDTGHPALDFDIRPEELIRWLDQYVIRQDEAKRVLATKICTHFNRIRRELENPVDRDRDIGRIKSNVLLIGPTGVGKTYLIKLIARRIGVPFVKGDATKFSETGYVGGDVEDLVRDLVRQADGDIERAQYGIVYLDEVDKIAASPNRIGADVSRTGVQRALLKPMEETEVEMKVAHDPISQIEAIEHYRRTGKRERKVINTRHVLFIMSGSFAGLEEIIGRRTGRRSMGFNNPVAAAGAPASRLLKEVKAEDLIEFGFESEFVGRLPVVAVLDQLTVDDLFHILCCANSSVVNAKKRDFLAYDIRLVFSEEALHRVAEKAALERTGARGLVSVMERVLLPFETRLPSTDIAELAVTPAMVEDPDGELERLLATDEARETNRALYEELAAAERRRLSKHILEVVGEYLEEYGVRLTPERLGLMARCCQEENADPRDLADLLVDLVDEINRFAGRLSAKCGVRVVFSDEAVDRALEEAGFSRSRLKKILADIGREFEYGLCLLAQRETDATVVVETDGVDDPKGWMEDLIAAKFKL